MKRPRSEQSSMRLTTLAATFLACITLTRTAELRQHRVRKAHRHVIYRHLIDGKRIRAPFEKFYRRDTAETYVTEEASVVVSYDDNELFWHMQVEAVDPQHQEDVEDKRGFLRRLYDQFIGEDSAPEDVSNSTNVTVEFGNSTSENNASSFVYTAPDDELLNTTKFQPLRIRAILAQGDGYLLLEEERDLLFHGMLSPALLSWSSSLRVDPVVGNLTVDVNQLVDGETCGPGVDTGLPSMRVPLSHLTEGIPDTDMIVYLSLGFVVPRNVSNSTNSTISQQAQASRSNQQKLYGPTDNNETTLKYDDENSTLVDSADLMNSTQEFSNKTDAFHSTIATNFKNICNGQHLAAASFCSTDQYDRPTAALLHICIDESFFHPDRIQRNTITLMHEIGHALGFNSLSMAHFRRPDGTPYTPRVNGDVPDTFIECTGPTMNRKWANIALPSDEILQFREVRGGLRVAELVTPSVVQVVRNQFDCQQLIGAELESDEGLPLSIGTDSHGCIGDHWERRLFSSDLMNPVLDDVVYSTRISTLTLAYFADSGWYQVDLSNAEVAAGWGRGAGCTFANETCIGKNGEVPPQNAPFFCNDIPTEFSRTVASDIHGCTPDLSRKAICSMGQYDLDLPWEYQYFHDTYGSDVGGSDALMDYCPVYDGFANGACSALENQNYVRVDDIERFGVRNSRCLLGSSGSRFSRTALCLPIACVIEDRSLRIRVGRNWRVCDEADQEIVQGDFTVICPDPRRICPTFYCPYDCLGTGGRCDYLSGKCLCEYRANDGIDETVWQVCRSADNGEPPGKDPFGPFLRPIRPDNEGSVVPHPDSPLSDYYVPSERALEETEDPFLPPWLVGASIAGGLVVAIICLWFLWGYCWARCLSRSGSEDIGDGVTINRNKDKMIATVLVDMRIRQHDASLAETSEHMTESEAASGPPGESFSELSSQRSDSMSDVDVSMNEITEEDLKQLRGEAEEELKEEPWVIRRRRITAECKKMAMMLHS